MCHLWFRNSSFICRIVLNKQLNLPKKFMNVRQQSLWKQKCMKTWVNIRSTLTSKEMKEKPILKHQQNEKMTCKVKLTIWKNTTPQKQTKNMKWDKRIWCKNNISILDNINSNIRILSTQMQYLKPMKILSIGRKNNIMNHGHLQSKISEIYFLASWIIPRHNQEQMMQKNASESSKTNVMNWPKLRRNLMVKSK